MCIGIPMQIIEMDGVTAMCEGMGQRRRIDMSLVGEQPPKTWILTFLDSAREIISETQASQIIDALTALDLAMQGRPEGIDALFKDLTEREPQLPPHLR